MPRTTAVSNKFSWSQRGLSHGSSTVINIFWIPLLSKNPECFLLVVFWDSSRNTFNIDEQLRKSSNSVIFAGATFTYTPDSYLSGRGAIASAGPTDRPITLYVSMHPNTREIFFTRYAGFFFFFFFFFFVHAQWNQFQKKGYTFRGVNS